MIQWSVFRSRRSVIRWILVQSGFDRSLIWKWIFSLGNATDQKSWSGLSKGMHPKTVTFAWKKKTKQNETTITKRPICNSQTLRNSCCSSLRLAHRRFVDPSNLVFMLIIALIWNIRNPFQFGKCRNSRVKTINIATIDAITMAPGLRTSSEG